MKRIFQTFCCSSTKMHTSLFLLLLSLPLSASHYTFSPSPTTAASDWKPARATYYASADPRDSVGGACGYGDLSKAGYGLATVGLSSTLFERGQTCGACYQIKCVEDLRWCIPGTSVIVTATNFCAPNYGFEKDGGGYCNPPNDHFVLPIEAFEKIAIWKAGNMPVQYRRIKCRKEGGIQFTVDGSGIFISVLITNVAGAGDIVGVKIKGSRTGWLGTSMRIYKINLFQLRLLVAMDEHSPHTTLLPRVGALVRHLKGSNLNRKGLSKRSQVRYAILLFFLYCVSAKVGF